MTELSTVPAEGPATAPTADIALVWNPSKTSEKTLRSALNGVAAKRKRATGIADDWVGKVRWYETSRDDPGAAATREALRDGARLVLAAGGDGTIRAVAEALAEHASEADPGAAPSHDTEAGPVGLADLGILPLGTGNLLARNLGIAIHNLQDALDTAVFGEALPIDIGWATLETAVGAEERHAFAVMAGFGIDAHMITETKDDLKSQVGWAAYVESLGRAISASQVIGVRVSIDDEAPEAIDAHTMIVGNCGSIQAGMNLLPGADPSDGQLDMLVLSAAGLGGWLDTMHNMAWQNGLKRRIAQSDETTSSGSVTRGRGQQIRFELEEPRVFEVDGDALDEVVAATLTVQETALRVRGGRLSVE
ncbi:diacylglycerol/lipid kinase family protein [Leucobacter chinensis]|uniref:diacylglycerol/lipid kinase family protein n=1 Tax=Leucobacter chinensis TaxID=2851010 RepID=UPI001C210CE1|nr:diacylglycerol kinase family protein [Leucobacter chinensis]